MVTSCGTWHLERERFAGMSQERAEGCGVVLPCSRALRYAQKAEDRFLVVKSMLLQYGACALKIWRRNCFGTMTEQETFILLLCLWFVTYLAVSEKLNIGLAVFLF